MKYCPKCETDLPKEEFYEKGKGRLQPYCKSCFNKYCIERWIQRKKDAIERLGGKCNRCGYKKHYAALQFHHLRDKDLVWNKLRLRSWDKIIKELDKCELLCANCHAVEHASQDL